MIIDIAIQGQDTETPAVSLVTPRARKWARDTPALPTRARESAAFEVDAGDLAQLIALARSAGMRVGMLHERAGKPRVTLLSDGDAPEGSRTGAAPARTTVYFTVLEDPQPRSSRRMRCGWAAWWTSDPRQQPMPEPDDTGAAPEPESLREYLSGYLRALHAVTARLVEVDLPVEWAPAPTKARSARSRPHRSPPRRGRAARPGWAAVLGLELPCTERDVHRAYRRTAAEKHPDRGGTQEEFVAVGRARDAALAALGGEGS